MVHNSPTTLISPKGPVTPNKLANKWCSLSNEHPPSIIAALLNGAKQKPSIFPSLYNFAAVLIMFKTAFPHSALILPITISSGF